MNEAKVKKINRIYLVFLIIVLIIIIIFSFNAGRQAYYLINTNLDDANAPVTSEPAYWKFEVTIAY
ncbi:MAG: hypothetical protein IJ867_03900 [Clostridia bacterium]|nr:hypothetical protein [Clostridia bacterium]